MSKGFWGVIAAIVVVFFGIYFVNANKSDDTSKSSSTSAATNHTLGKGTSGVTFQEFGDYQCPACAQYHPIIKQVVAKYNDAIKFQFSNFPLTSIHPNAFAAARAAEAAAKQDKFWEMHDLLYETQQQWSVGSDPTPFFDQMAKQLGLDEAKFKKDYASSEVNSAINADMAKGNELKVTGTPAFFINGKKVEVKPTVESISKVIDDAIAKNSSSTQATTPAKQ